ITGHGTIETAVTATKLGAFDLIEKPLSIDKIIVSISNALNFRRLEEENKYLRKKAIDKNSINGNSAAVADLKNKILVIAASDKWVLISGENGTGKELVSRTIHQLSTRATQPLITVNCAAIPDELIESELFGHEKGALPGAKTKKRGQFELANNGTLFFDEICDMSLSTQSKLLRVLEEKKFQRVGSSRFLEMNVRIVAASNRNLQTEIKNGTFRKDLYYRLNVIPIEVPPLRERKEDIPTLIDIFLNDFTKENPIHKKELKPGAVELLCNYDWPGNVRELKNLIERLCIMVNNKIIDVDDIPPPYKPSAIDESKKNGANLFVINNFKEAKKAFEKEFLTRKILQYNNNVSDIARAIGTGRSYLQKKIKDLNKNT
ncbi:MAG: sigma-54-dependent Fis family transcriptional regulator, partial [Deltaproteobacteria bacterium]|nr:sigma-54-dependent Fis family transcriptional regulator [Deltaproteobacteria bacterium]